MALVPQIYRHGHLGTTLIDTIDEFTVAEKIDPQLSKKILEEFDRIMYEEFTHHVKGKNGAKMTFKGDLDTYRHCDNIWEFHLKNVTFMMEGGGKGGSKVMAKKVTIISYNADP
ncbi:hypothetical protein OQA88_4458 [Cercophora sp. LCS_1]